jgi:hypothetical protein
MNASPPSSATIKNDKTDRANETVEAAGGPMSDRIDFEIVCPNDHDQTVTFSQEEFEKALKSDDLVFHCNTCDANWPPSRAEIAEFRKQFAKKSS